MGGKISHEDERDSDNDSAEEEDGYYEPLQDDDFTMITKINKALSLVKKEVRVSGAMLTNIINNIRKEGTLTLKVQWENKDTTWETLQDLKEDHPRLFASYLITHNCSQRKKRNRDVNLSWAKKTFRDYDRAIRIITRLYDFYLDKKQRRLLRKKNGDQKA